MTLELERQINHVYEDGVPVALLFFDLDNFKLANDLYGHRFGDEILVWLGDFLPGVLPPQATISRYAGDAFVAILPETAIDEAVAVAERLRAELAERTFATTLGHSVLLSISVGVAGIDPASHEIDDAATLLHAADRAMYAAKLAGRNRVARWTAQLADELQRRATPDGGSGRRGAPSRR
jgi:diguanylate cyclase (GGDEF)-like protein